MNALTQPEPAPVRHEECPNDPFSADLRGRVEATWERLLVERNDAETMLIVDELIATGLDPIVLKGPATRAALGVTDQRPSSDVDLLFGPDQWSGVTAVLRCLGYRRRRGVHADTWSKPGRADVDAHWTLPRSALSAREVWTVLQPYRSLVACGSRTVPSLDGAGQFVHLAIHASMDRSGRPDDDLRGAAARLTRATEWRAVGLAEQLGVNGSVAWTLEEAGLVECARSFGAAQLEPHDPRDAGWIAFARSRVHRRERWRRTLRIAEKYVRWQAGRWGRLLTGRARITSGLPARISRS